MGANELLLVLTAILCAGVVLVAWQLDKERLHSSILIFLILISVMGGKIVEFFGYETNTGNIFYASIFLATYFLIERYGKREGLRSIWIGILGVIFFSALLQISLLYTSTPTTESLSAALREAFAPLSRVALASLIGYTVSQAFNVFLFLKLKQQFINGRLWLRANLANAGAQLVDSAIFFSIAFSGIVSTENIVEIIVTGFVIKVLFMMIAAPLLYLNRIEEEDGEGYASIAFK